MATTCELALLKENWDGYGAAPFQSETLANTKLFEDLLRGAGYAVVVTPMSNGCLMIEWAANDREYTLEIGRTQISGLVEPEADGS